MASHILGYPFVGNSVVRPMVPVVISHPTTGSVQGFYALVDTGADSCLIPSGVANILGCDLKSGKPNKAKGVGSLDMETWKHSLIINLLTPDRKKIAWTSIPSMIACSETHDLPLILGNIGFLQYFKATFDYPRKALFIEF